MAYTLLKDVYLDGEVKPAGSVVEIRDAQLAKDLLSRGSISDGAEAPAEPVAEVDDQPNLPPSDQEVAQAVEDLVPPTPSQDLEVK